MTLGRRRSKRIPSPVDAEMMETRAAALALVGVELAPPRPAVDSCWYCGGRVYRVRARPGRPTPLDARSIDHLTPRSRGGSDAVKNTVVACLRCNQAKADRTLAEWKVFLVAAGADMEGQFGLFDGTFHGERNP